MATTEYKPGNYISNKPLRVIKKLETVTVLDANGKAQRTQGTWNRPDNFYTFGPNTKVKLTEEDLKNTTIYQLIKKGVLQRVL